MDGKQVKEILKKHHVNIASIADAMGTTPQNLGSKFKGKDLGTIFLLKLSKATNISFLEFLPEEVQQQLTGILTEPEESYTAKPLTEKINILSKELERIKAELAQKKG